MKKKLNLDAGLLAAAAQSKQRAAAAKPEKEDAGLVQYNVRVDAGTRERLRYAAEFYRITERELIRQFAATLPEPVPKPKLHIRVS